MKEMDLLKIKVRLCFNLRLGIGVLFGIAVLDNSSFGAGNLLMCTQLRNPRYIYTGDQIKFDVRFRN